MSLAKVFIWAHGLVVSTSSVARLAAISAHTLLQAPVVCTSILRHSRTKVHGRFLKQALPVTETLPYAVDEPLAVPALTTQTAKIGLSSPFLKALASAAEWTASSPPSCTRSFWHGSRSIRRLQKHILVSKQFSERPSGLCCARGLQCGSCIKPSAMAMANLQNTPHTGTNICSFVSL